MSSLSAARLTRPLVALPRLPSIRVVARGGAEYGQARQAAESGAQTTRSRGAASTEHTGLAMRFSVARSARSLLTQQMRPISTCRLREECGASVPLPAVELQIRRPRGRRLDSSNQRTAARRLASSGMAVTGAPRHATGPTPKQPFADPTKLPSTQAGTGRRTKSSTGAHSVPQMSPEAEVFGVRPTAV